jgi:hypothetical protein
VIVGTVLQSLWFAVPAVFLARGSRVARGFAIYLSLIGLAAALVFTIALIAAGLIGLALLAAPLALPFLFSAWALLFYRDLQVALVWRMEKWNAVEKARLQELEGAMGEGSEK